MAMTYTEFTAFLTTMLWRQNDADLAANMDNLIRMAHHDLNKKLAIQRREVTLNIAPETEDYVLPADFYQMMSLTNRQLERQRKSGVMKSSTLSAILHMRDQSDSMYVEPFYYVQRTSTANTLYLVGPFSADNPGSLTIQYRTAIPDYATTDASWLEDEYLDLYVYSVFKHVAIFLREDERITQYVGLMTDALESALDEDQRLVRFGGSPLHMQPTRPVPQTRR